MEAHTITLTASGSIWDGPCHLSAYSVKSTSAGTLLFRDGGPEGTPIGDVMTPSKGFKMFPFDIATSAYAEIGGLLEVKFYFTTEG